LMIEKLLEEFSALPQIEAAALGGSRAGERFDAASDYDIYLYCTAPVDERTRRTILEKYCSHMEIGNHFWEVEDNCTLNDGVDIDILYRDLDDFAQGVARVVENFQPSNAYTTCMWHNLNTCKILWDKTGRLGAMKARFSVPYPAALRENIISNGLRLLRGNLPSYDGQIAKAARRGDLVSVNHRTAAWLETYFDVLLAVNARTHPGEKRLVELCCRECEKLPERFEENLNALFAVLFIKPEKIAPILADMTAQLEKLI